MGALMTACVARSDDARLLFLADFYPPQLLTDIGGYLKLEACILHPNCWQLYHAASYMLLHPHCSSSTATNAAQYARNHSVVCMSAGPAPCYALVHVKKGGKTQKNGQKQDSAAVRHRDPALCPIGHLARHFARRFTILMVRCARQRIFLLCQSCCKYLPHSLLPYHNS